MRFGEALHRAWQAAKLAPVNAARIAKAAINAGAPLDCLTWRGWREAGYQVRHGEKALFAVDLHWPTKGDGAIYRASFFSVAQVEPLTT